jgi:hypothetical protein
LSVVDLPESLRNTPVYGNDALRVKLLPANHTR